MSNKFLRGRKPTSKDVVCGTTSSTPDLQSQLSKLLNTTQMYQSVDKAS